MDAGLHHLRRDHHGEAGEGGLVVGEGGLKVLAADAVMGVALGDAVHEDLDAVDLGAGEGPAVQGHEAADGLDGDGVAGEGGIEEEADRRLALRRRSAVAAGRGGEHAGGEVGGQAGADRDGSGEGAAFAADAGDVEGEHALAEERAGEGLHEPKAGQRGRADVGVEVGDIGPGLGKGGGAHGLAVQGDGDVRQAGAADGPAFDGDHAVLGEGHFVQRRLDHRRVGAALDLGGAEQGGVDDAALVAGGGDGDVDGGLGQFLVGQFAPERPAGLPGIRVVAVLLGDVGPGAARLRVTEGALAGVDADLLDRRLAHRPAADGEDGAPVDAGRFDQDAQRLGRGDGLFEPGGGGVEARGVGALAILADDGEGELVGEGPGGGGDDEGEEGGAGGEGRDGGAEQEAEAGASARVEGGRLDRVGGQPAEALLRQADLRRAEPRRADIADDLRYGGGAIHPADGRDAAPGDGDRAGGGAEELDAERGFGHRPG